jgi:hypothetical protein
MLTTFIQNFDRVILLSFGTTFSPNHDQIMNLAAALALKKGVGCIASIKDSVY